MRDEGFRVRRLIKKIPWLLVGPVFYLLFRLFFLWPDFTEKVYSRAVYRIISQGLSAVTGLLPFSLAELLLYAFLLFVIVYIIVMLIKTVLAKREWWYELLNWLLALLCVFSCIYALFVGLWGFNYSREPLGSILKLDTSPASVSELYSTCEALIAKANTLRAAVPEDESGVYSPDFTKNYMMNATAQYYNLAAELTGKDFLGGSYGGAKPVIYSAGLSYAHISGVYFPFTAEANLNIDVPMLYFAASTLHESAHQRGFAREDEANFLAYYVASYSGDASVEYSGTMLALSESMNQLYENDSDLYFELRRKYSEGINRDLQNNHLYWQRYESPVNETSKAVNNTFLKANMQKEGVKSYGRMVDLLIALWRQCGITNSRAIQKAA
ncbi:MAG: DUF3810 domain-containing protein [Burkholderiales bacterium]